MSLYIKHFYTTNNQLHVTELGHRKTTEPHSKGPWSREFYILHLIVKEYSLFSGFKVEEGQAFFVTKKQLHSITTSETEEHYWIGFDGSAVGPLFEQFKLKHDIHQIFFVENYQYAKNLFATVCEKLQNNDAEDEHSLALSVLTSLLPLLKSEVKSEAAAKNNYAEKVYTFIKTNYMYPIKMENIAQDMHLSEKYMYRLFAEQYHMSPQQFLIKTRMEVAKNLLETSILSVSEVARAVGYKTLPVFSKIFANHFGISPSVLKKKNKES